MNFDPLFAIYKVIKPLKVELFGKLQPLHQKAVECAFKSIIDPNVFLVENVGNLVLPTVCHPYQVLMTPVN